MNEGVSSPVELITSLMKGDGMADLFEELVDVAIRVGALNDSMMIARSLSPFKQFVCASPDYLAVNGATAASRHVQRSLSITSSARASKPCFA
jgi:DNA-binding transcriptional LysR family regulator